MMKRLIDWIRGRSAPQVDLDAFSSSQIASKAWLCERLEECLKGLTPPVAGYKIWIFAGWYGVTNFMLRTRAIVPVEFVRSIDLDPTCEPIADRINKFWEIQGWQFKAQTGDINNTTYFHDNPHIIIMTSAEHVKSLKWFLDIPRGTIVAIQGSDLVIPDHVNPISSVEQLKEAYPMECHYEGSITFNYPTHSFNRHMIIGIKP